MPEWKEEEINDFFERCLQRFGSMNKNDYEVALFHLLINNEYANMSDFGISLKLRIPESKVKRLRYEESLIYDNKRDETYLKELGLMLVKRKYRVQHERILFAISDKSLRLFLNDYLMADGRFADSSFNCNIVALKADDLLFLLEKTDNKNENVIATIRKDIESSKKDLPKTITEILKDFALGTTKKTLEKVAGKVVTDELSNFLIELCKQIKEKVNNKQ